MRPAAKSGGLSSIVRSAAVHDELTRTRPDLARVLYEPWWRDMRTGDGQDSFRQSPAPGARKPPLGYPLNAHR